MTQDNDLVFDGCTCIKSSGAKDYRFCDRNELMKSTSCNLCLSV
jgi:hypothetical protein